MILEMMMTDQERIKNLEQTVAELQRQLGLLQARMPFRSLGKNRHAPELKDTVVPNRK